MSTNFVRDYQVASKPQTSEKTQHNRTWNSRILKEADQDCALSGWKEWHGAYPERQTCRMSDRLYWVGYLCRSHAFGGVLSL